MDASCENFLDRVKQQPPGDSHRLAGGFLFFVVGDLVGVSDDAEEFFVAGGVVVAVAGGVFLCADFPAYRAGYGGRAIDGGEVVGAVGARVEEAEGAAVCLLARLAVVRTVGAFESCI